MSSGAFSRRAFRIGAICMREAIIALKSSKKSPLYPSGKRKMAMLPTCIGISGVSRYKNDASIEDSFLASPIFPSRTWTDAAPCRRFWSSGGLCIFRGRICNGKGPGSVKLPELTLGLSQTIRDRPQSGGIDPEPGMAGEVDLDILGGLGGTNKAGPPVHDAVRAGIDRGGRHRQVAGYRFSKLGILGGRLARQHLVESRGVGRPHVPREWTSEGY